MLERFKSWKEKHLLFAAITLTAVGFWPIETKSRKKLLLYNVFFVITTIWGSAFVLSLFIELKAQTAEGVTAFVSHLVLPVHFAFNLLQAQYSTWKASKLLLKKVEVTERNIMDKGTPEVKAIFFSQVKRHTLLNMFFLFSAFMCDFTYTLAPFVSKYGHFEESDQLVFPLEIWVPWDKFGYYKTSFFYLFTGAVIDSAYSVGCYYIFYGMIQFGITNFRIIKHEIVTGIDGKLTEAEIQQNIRKIVIYYNNIIEFVEQLDNILTYLQMVAYFIFIEQIAILGFRLVTEGLSIDLVKSIVFMNSLILDLVIYYWMANEITLENYGVADTIWNSDWYNCSKSVKRSLILIIIRSQRPLQLTVGPFSVMSNETMVNILKTGVSYATALRKFQMVKTEMGN